MAQVTRNIVVDVSRPNYVLPITAKQGDCNSRYLKITIQDNEETISIPETSQAVLNYARFDGKRAAVFGVVNSDGTVTVPLDKSVLEFGGTLSCSVTILDEENQRKLTTTSFAISVEPAEYTDGDIRAAENYDVLLNLISKAEAAQAAAEDAQGLSEAARDTAIGDAEAAEESANQAKGYKEFIEDYAEAFSVFEIYNPSKQYVEGNKVSHNGSSYYCIKDSLGNAPTNTTYWLLIAEKGDTGATGATGAKGKDGADGHTPVKGTDYFTDADKLELVADVLAEIPVVESEGY